jgi:hypothetical protein
MVVSVYMVVNLFICLKLYTFFSLIEIFIYQKIKQNQFGLYKQI